jgi:hypothetical protein
VHEPIANCEICGEPIFVDLGDERGAASRYSLNRKLERAASVWQSAVKHIYGELREMWGEADSRGVYSIDEVLGSPSIYRLWMDADRCTFAACPHAAAA